MLSYDSINQLSLIDSGDYTNHHPYFYTQIVHLPLVLGDISFGDLNAVVASYSVFSILFLSFCFSYAVCTVLQFGENIVAAAVVFVIFVLMPYHIVYSITMRKDVFYAAAVLLLSIGAFLSLRVPENILDLTMWQLLQVHLACVFGAAMDDMPLLAPCRYTFCVFGTNFKMSTTRDTT